jgi:hypothetical protein
MVGTLSLSRFAVWRALVALAHVDGKFTPEEWRFLMPAILDQPLSDEQKRIIQDDMKYARGVKDMFALITEDADRTEFFRLANQLVYADGDFDESEQKIIAELNKSDGYLFTSPENEAKHDAEKKEAVTAAETMAASLATATGPLPAVGIDIESMPKVKLKFDEEEDLDGMNIRVDGSIVTFSQTRKTEED